MTAEMEKYRLADICRAIGAKPRSVQNWADARAIHPIDGTDRRGSGAHRLFYRSEIDIAWVIAKFAEFGTSISGLIEIGKALRNTPRLAEDGAHEIVLTFYHGRFIVVTPHLCAGPLTHRFLWPPPLSLQI